MAKIVRCLWQTSMHFPWEALEYGPRGLNLPAAPTMSRDKVAQPQHSPRPLRISAVSFGLLVISCSTLAIVPAAESPVSRRLDHWAFKTPTRPASPHVSDANWVRNGIDAFILARLDREGVRPSPEADRTTLIRRVTLDLTGLPPTPAEVDAFLADDSTSAYERVVDRLLASPRYGERMAVPWLYAARYADTSGYQNDGPRHMWRWRDWVIDAFNRNMPFDQFTVEQIAGDLLPDPTLEQRIATGFNRNHRGNAEGGIIPEEYAVEYVVDRVETTATVFLGLTLGCARCHDHKYDPFTQKDFYQYFAYFNNIPEFGRAIKEGNSPPYIKAPTADDQLRLRQLDEMVAQADREVAGHSARLTSALTNWEKAIDLVGQPEEWSIAEGLAASFALNRDASEAGNRSGEGKFVDGEPAFAAGRLGEAADFDGRRFIDAGNIANFGYFDRFSLSAWIFPRGGHGGTIISRMTDADQADGYCVHLKNGRIQVNLVKRWLDDAIRVETERPLAPDGWQHVMVTYDGSRTAGGITMFIDGKPEKLSVKLDFINQSFAAKEPLRIGGGSGPEGRFVGLIDDVRIYNECLSADDVRVIATPDSIRKILDTPADQRGTNQIHKLRAYFLATHAPASIRVPYRNMLELRKERERFVEGIPTVMVMEEMPVPRDTFVLLRGQYDKQGEKVTPAVLANLAPLPVSAPNNRLGLARWLVNPSNPLTARVAVNRFWQMYFGTGLVKSVEDFGTQCEPPTHSQLLDWLACEFSQSDSPTPYSSLLKRREEERSGGVGETAAVRPWDIKHFQRLIVTSATYRQSSKVSPAALAKDPDNQWLARAPRLRLTAEMIRDQALAASGLLVAKLGGPSVKPYQPAGLWKEIATDGEYLQDQGDNLYRRSLYTYWKRTVAPPSMITFDATARETCTVRETRTNTPLQSLTLMNEITYVEAARVLAQRIMTEGGATPQDRIVMAFRLVTARVPRPAELQILLRGLEEHLANYRSDPKAAEELISAGEFPRNKNLDTSELAAYTAIAGLILNLDETVTKE